MKKTQIISLLLILCLLGTLDSFAQKEENKEFIQTKNARESLKIAQQFINSGALEKAKRQLKYTIRLKNNFAVAYRELGRVYFELEEYGNAIDTYENSFNNDPNISRAAYYECGESYFKLGQFEQALYYYNEYSSRKTSKYANKKLESGLEIGFDEELEIRLENIRFVTEAQAQDVEHYPKNLGNAINTQHNEYLPAISNTGNRLVFTRDIKGRNENIFTSSFNKEREWSTARKLDNKVNSHRNEGMAKFAADGKVFYFTGCKRPDSEGGCDIYAASLDLFGEVENVEHIEGPNSRSWDSQPCVTCNNDRVYFSSTRPGGYGGADLYVSYKNEDGTWTEGENLGSEINTKHDEEAPFIASDGVTLYFTSTGLPGQGDGDLFMSRNNGEGWTKPANLGYPINTQSKELGIYVHKDSRTIFFASARTEGNGGLDIYQYELPEELRPKIMNNVYGFISDDETGEPIQTPFKIYREGESYAFQSNERGAFFTCLKQNKAYTFHVEVDGYKPFMSAVFLEPPKNNEPSAVEIKLIPIKKDEPVVAKYDPKDNFTIERRPRNIVKRVAFYFDKNSSDLNPQTLAKLDDLAGTLSNSLDKWTIEVVGFADHTGSADYNKVLSEKRANSVAEYLTTMGVPINNVRQEGKGAIASHSTLEMKMNRRVEVILKGQILERVKIYNVN